jgi:hypothetical protein
VIGQDAAFRLPARQELVETGGLERRPGQVVIPGRRGLVDDDDTRLAAVTVEVLAKVDRGREAGRTGADDQDVYRLDG